jgi:ankyrin repeat protein
MDTNTETDTTLSPEFIQEFVIAAHGDFPKVREMLAKEPGLLNAKWAQVDENGLEASGHMGRADIANFFLDSGAPLTIFAAAMLGRTEDVQAFIQENPALASANGVHGISILYHAAHSGNTEIVDMLVANGGGQEAGHALHAAVEHGHADMVERLLALGGDPNAKDFRGKTTLDAALDRGYTEIAEMLRAHGGVESPSESS